MDEVWQQKLHSKCIHQVLMSMNHTCSRAPTQRSMYGHCWTDTHHITTAYKKYPLNLTCLTRRRQQPDSRWVLPQNGNICYVWQASNQKVIWQKALPVQDCCKADQAVLWLKSNDLKLKITRKIEIDLTESSKLNNLSSPGIPSDTHAEQF